MNKAIVEDCVTPHLAGPLIDWHCHILPGLDDGAESLPEALEIARILSGAGFAEVYCTPHCIRGLYDNTPQIVRRAVTELQMAIERNDIPLRVYPGMEYFLDEYFVSQLDDPLPLGESKFLLVETSPQAAPERVKELLFAIRRRGLIPLVAHPERYEYFSDRNDHEKRGLLGRLTRRVSGRRPTRDQAPGLLHDLLAMGCHLQGNLGSFAGIYGSEVQQKAEQYLAASGYHCFGSDAHRSGSLEKTLARGLTAVGIDV